MRLVKILKIVCIIQYVTISVIRHHIALQHTMTTLSDYGGVSRFIKKLLANGYQPVHTLSELLLHINIPESATDIAALLLQSLSRSQSQSHTIQLDTITTTIERCIYICDELCAGSIIKRIIDKNILLDKTIPAHIINYNSSDHHLIENVYSYGYKVIIDNTINAPELHDLQLAHNAYKNGLDVSHVIMHRALSANIYDYSKFSDMLEDIENIKFVYKVGYKDGSKSLHDRVCDDTIGIISRCKNIKCLQIPDSSIIMTRDGVKMMVDRLGQCDNMRNLVCVNMRGIDDNFLRRCKLIVHLCVNNNDEVTTCAPFAKTLRILEARNGCGIGDTALSLCNKLRKLYASSNCKITTCIPFAKTLRVLYAGNTCGITDNGLQLCTNLCELYIHGNNNISYAPSPFEKSLKILYCENYRVVCRAIGRCEKLKYYNNKRVYGSK